MSLDDKPKKLVASSERARIDRKVLIWINKCDILPVETVTTEAQLGTNIESMAVSAINTAYINQSYITGGYEAEYQFTLIYRIKPGNSMDKSLTANEVLNQIGDWASDNKPDLGEEIRVKKVEPMSIAYINANYQDGDEDHHIPIKIIYEVM